MAIIHNDAELERYIDESVSVSFERPVLIDRFLDNAIEIDVDAICDGHRVIVCGIMEHIERAGIHSGDSTFMLPTQTLSDTVVYEIEKATKDLARACDVRGLVNVQYAVTSNGLYVIEVNPRASRSVPFVSKVTGVPWAKIGARVMAGELMYEIDSSGVYGSFLQFEDYRSAVAPMPYVAIKEAVFPFVKFRGVDAILGPEMRSTGEVMGIAKTRASAFSRAQDANGKELPTKGAVFFSLKDEDKEPAIPIIKKFSELGYTLVATRGTAAFIEGLGVAVEPVNKVREGSVHIVDLLLEGKIDLVINTPEGTGPLLDSRSIRTTTIDQDLPLFTTLAAAYAAVEALEEIHRGTDIPVASIQEYLSAFRG